MLLADEVREFVFKNYVEPTRNRGGQTVDVRAGDVHDRMRLKNRMPAVCGAIGTIKFEERYGVRLVNRDGPTNGSDVVFTFRM